MKRFLDKYESAVNNRCRVWLGMSLEEYESRSLLKRLGCLWNTSFCRSVGIEKEEWEKRPNKRRAEGIENRGLRKGQEPQPPSSSDEEEEPGNERRTNANGPKSVKNCTGSRNGHKGEPERPVARLQEKRRRM